MGSVGLVVLFCLLVVVYLRVSQGITFRMMDSLINVDNVITDLSLKSTAAMIDARRLEKDFLLNYQEFGFEESRSRYITRWSPGRRQATWRSRRSRTAAVDPGDRLRAVSRASSPGRQAGTRLLASACTGRRPPGRDSRTWERQASRASPAVRRRRRSTSRHGLDVAGTPIERPAPGSPPVPAAPCARTGIFVARPRVGRR